MLGVPIDSNEAQAALMLIAYREAHRADEHPPIISLSDLENGNSTVESAAGDEWIAEPDGEMSLSALYRAYIEKHPHQRINVQDEHVLQDIVDVLSRVRRMSLYRKSQLH